MKANLAALGSAPTGAGITFGSPADPEAARAFAGTLAAVTALKHNVGREPHGHDQLPTGGDREPAGHHPRSHTPGSRDMAPGNRSAGHVNPSDDAANHRPVLGAPAPAAASPFSHDGVAIAPRQGEVHGQDAAAPASATAAVTATATSAAGQAASAGPDTAASAAGHVATAPGQGAALPVSTSMQAAGPSGPAGDNEVTAGPAGQAAAEGTDGHGATAGVTGRSVTTGPSTAPSAPGTTPEPAFEQPESDIARALALRFTAVDDTAASSRPGRSESGSSDGSEPDTSGSSPSPAGAMVQGLFPALVIPVAVPQNTGQGTPSPGAPAGPSIAPAGGSSAAAAGPTTGSLFGSPPLPNGAGVPEETTIPAQRGPMTPEAGRSLTPFAVHGADTGGTGTTPHSAGPSVAGSIGTAQPAPASTVPTLFGTPPNPTSANTASATGSFQNGTRSQGRADAAGTSAAAEHTARVVFSHSPTHPQPPAGDQNAAEVPALAAAPPVAPSSQAAPPTASASSPGAHVAGQLTEQLTGQVVRLRSLSDGTHRLVLRITPDELGPVKVVAQIRGGNLQLELHATTPSGQAALSAAVPQVRADLARVAPTATLDLGQSATGGSPDGRSPFQPNGSDLSGNLAGGQGGRREPAPETAWNGGADVPAQRRSPDRAVRPAATGGSDHSLDVTT